MTIMITINRSEIQALIIDYKENGRGRAKKATDTVASIVANLEIFVNSLPVNEDLLDNTALYDLAVILLKREKSTRFIGNKPTKSEELAMKLEAKFDVGFSVIKAKFDNHQLSLEEFNSIYQALQAPGTTITPTAPTHASPSVAQSFFSKFSFTGSNSKKLLDHVSLGEMKQAEVIWRKNPKLLLKKGKVKRENCLPIGSGNIVPFHDNPGFYEYNHTAYQIALMNEEFEAATKMQEHMPDEEIIKQFDEIFPDGVIKSIHIDLSEGEAKLNHLFKLLIEFPDCYDFNKMSPDIEAALHDLYSYAKPKQKVTQGLVFDYNLYKLAKELYNSSYYSNPNTDIPLPPKNSTFYSMDMRRAFWCVRVEEWLAGCLGTAHLRRHAYGLVNRDDSADNYGNPDHNSGIILFNPGISYFSPRVIDGQQMILGRNACVGNSGQLLMPGINAESASNTNDYNDRMSRKRVRESRRHSGLFDGINKDFFAEKNQQREAFSALIANLRQGMAHRL